MAWFRTELGKAIPINPEPVADGNIVIRGGLAVVVGSDLLAPTAEEGEPKYKSHFATCPHASEFRRKKR
jgi:hypothetical protein